MTDNRDDILIRRFFDENKSVIEDKGFTRRVMRRLPYGTRRINRIWTAACAAAGMALFVSCRGWEIFAGCIKGIVTDVVYDNVMFHNPGLIIVMLLVLAGVGGYNALVSEQ